jgi:hypothetical protein
MWREKGGAESTAVMQFIALEKELKPFDPATDGEFLRAEAAAVWALRKAARVREIWFTHPARTAVLLLEAGSLEEARDWLDGLPLVRGGFCSFEVSALTPYDGFERLFREV